MINCANYNELREYLTYFIYHRKLWVVGFLLSVVCYWMNDLNFVIPS